MYFLGALIRCALGLGNAGNGTFQVIDYANIKHSLFNVGQISRDPGYNRGRRVERRTH